MEDPKSGADAQVFSEETPDKWYPEDEKMAEPSDKEKKSDSLDNKKEDSDKEDSKKQEKSDKDDLTKKKSEKDGQKKEDEKKEDKNTFKKSRKKRRGTVQPAPGYVGTPMPAVLKDSHSPSTRNLVSYPLM